MKISAFFFFCLTFFPFEADSDVGLKNILKKTSEVNIVNQCFCFDSLQNKSQNVFLDSTSFVCVYQVDSLIKKGNTLFYIESPVYVIGKVNGKNYDILVTLRYYGEWFKTIDLLTYDKQGQLKGYLILAGYGGDEGYSFDSFGCFERNEYIQTAYSSYFEEESVNCIKKCTRSKIDSYGKVEIININEEKIQCSD